MRDLPSTAGTALRVFFGHASPVLLVTLSALLIAVRVWLADWSWWDLVAVGAILVVWPVYEWVVHVTVLHFRPKRIGRFTWDLVLAKTHRHHHKDPWLLPIVFIPLRSFPYVLVPLLV